MIVAMCAHMLLFSLIRLGEHIYAFLCGWRTGLSYNPLKAVGEKIDLVNLMSYDADNQFSPILATQVGPGL